MTVAHDAVAAWPPGGSPDPDLIRALTERRFAYCLAASENAGDLVAADPVSGIVPLYLIQNSTMYAFDATDSTTAPSVVCLVTSDGKRFKTDTIAVPWSVLTKGTTAQPATPAVGDTYLIPTAATGVDWAGKDGKVGIYVAGGWRFAVVPLGRELYVQDEDAKYYRNASGVWTSGFGSLVLGAGAVKITNVLGAKASFVVKVENQTTNAEPTPTLGTNYVIGPSPTGTHWAGNAGKVAMCLDGSTWTIITPDAGDTVYDKAQANSYRFNGTAWISSAGAWLLFKKTGLDAGTFLQVGSGGYSYSGTTAPTIATTGFEDSATITHQATKSGVTLRFKYRASWTANGSNQTWTLALFRADSGGTYESNAVDWRSVISSINTGELDAELLVDTTDALTHTYKIKFISNGTSQIVSATRRRLTLEESS